MSDTYWQDEFAATDQWAIQLECELAEAQLEIARHHRDFTRISELVDYALRKAMGSDVLPLKALAEIRKIVG